MEGALAAKRLAMVEFGQVTRAMHWRVSLKHLTITLCLCAATACTQGPDYVRPSPEIPAAFRFGDDTSPETSVAETRAWWRAFGDEHLDRLVGEALANNRDLRIATARIDEFAAVLLGVQSQSSPQIGYAASGTRQRASERGNLPIPPRGDPVSSSFSAVLSASWEIDLWGRIRRETEAARANLLATSEAQQGVALSLVASVILGYVNLLDLDARLQISVDTLAARRQSVALYQKRRDAGYISDFELSQVLADQESAVVAIPDLQALIAQQEHALSVLVGRNPGPIVRARSLSDLDLITVPAALPADLLHRRPDILEAEQQLIASNALIGAARALYFPRISLTGIGGFASAALGDLFTGPARTWSFTGDVAGPIYTGGGLASATGQAEARRDQALANYERTIQNAFRDVEDSLIDLGTSGEIEESFERRVQALERGLALVQSRYDNGYADSLDVLDTERNLFSAQLSLAAARADRYRTLINLYRAFGGEWFEAGEAWSRADVPSLSAERRR